MDEESINNKEVVVESMDVKQDSGKNQDDGLDHKTLFIRSIPFDATSEELSEYFSQFVPVKHAVIVTDNEGKSRGFGFVSFTLDEDCLTALVESRKTKFKDRLLRVDVAKRRDRKQQEGSDRQEKAPVAPIEKRRARLIIRNLPWSCKKPDELKKIFSKYGAVFDAYIPKKKGGQMCGFAFVIMKKKSAAEKAVEGCQGLKINGREVAVDFAVEKSKWEQMKEEEEEEDDDESDEEEEEADSTNKDDNDQNEEEEGDDDESDNDDASSDFDELNEVNSDKELDGSDEEIEEPEKKEESSHPKKKSNRQEPFSIFIRNIPYDADAESLKEHFSTFGSVKYALPVVDKETGLSKGSAFVAFAKEDAYLDCLENAPTVASTSMLIADDVSPAYVYQGRILSIASAVDRDSASKLADRNLLKRKEALGKAPGEKDRRNLFLLNEGRITENSKLAQYISKTDLELREKSYKLRTQQLKKNPTLHLSLTRLAIRNLPRAMNAKALKALGRKAVVQFATEVKENKRQPLSKEEVNRSVKFKQSINGGEVEEEIAKSKNSKHKGVVKQAKVIMEVKGSGETGRSRGYGFIEFRDHKAALMGLRWLNAHEVSIPEILEGLTEEEKKLAELEGLNKRRLIVEFAIENAQVVKRRREKEMIARNQNKENSKKRKRDDEDNDETERTSKGKKSGASSDRKQKKARKGSQKKGNMNKGAPKSEESQKESTNKSGLSENVKKIIGLKRKRRKSKK
ncbi:nucleolar protein Nop4, putative [Candida dubliniensis CD36]|uniref:Nucleolar protein Nop4, putative n=1 Tax=Candida dubliniensis (strain CD36 / ATCC MYA-646 / CBS 7987 / NCPF 3949 / NRRL Y-17841) TaxID=573826 RepID=B9W7L3_CANDC|nr:nucleolar protein Nop4, putative [Candida dubliniensis CD36]CAX44674.1 nucleolar protein Nop4, putative [Candida dubliniensis CD36]